MAIFGRNTARQRLRRAARESLKIPAFSPPVDCTPWVLGGLWPAELSTVTADTAPLIEYLRDDLQRIVNSANEELKGLRSVGLADAVRLSEEARIINDARAFAIRRVESTVRHIRNNLRSKLPGESAPVNGGAQTQKTKRSELGPPQPCATISADAPALADSQRDRRPRLSVEQPQNWEPAVADLGPPSAEPATLSRKEPGLADVVDSDDTQILEEITTRLQEIAPLAEAPPGEQGAALPLKPPPTEWSARSPKSATEGIGITRHLPAVEPAKSERERLQRLLGFVARQEPGLRWAVGVQERGAVLLLTDLAHGWVPPGITLPAGVRLLEPGHRTGTLMALLGQMRYSETYTPGDQLNSVTDHDAVETSLEPRELPAVEDLGWALSEATHWRDGLPRIVHTIAKAGAAGTGILNSEIDTLRTYLDNSRGRLLAQYPVVDGGSLLNCVLLAATEGLATNNQLSANYHFAWFQRLSAPWAGGWSAAP